MNNYPLVADILIACIVTLTVLATLACVLGFAILAKVILQNLRNK